MNRTLYMDYAAATPMDKQVCEAMFEFLESQNYANPSASHKMGKFVRQIMEDNRQLVSDLIGADNNEIIWTSGATESNNLAILGIGHAYKHIGNHIITVATEHESILNTCDHLAKNHNFQITYLKPEKNGCINFDTLNSSITNQTILISVMLINNETGIIQDIARIAEIAREKGILLHVDAAQGGGKIKIDVKKLGANLMSLSAHKMYGPKGIGALYIDKDSYIKLCPVQHGGRQENGIRPGTLATHQIVGFGEACRIARQSLENDYLRATKLRDLFLSLSSDFALPNFSIEHTSPYIINVCFHRLNEKGRKRLNDSEQLILSSRSACSNHSTKNVSHVLEALGFDTDIMKNSYRISIGRYTNEDEVFSSISVLKQIFGEQND